MPRESVIQTNFAAGEASPRVEGRTDVQEYANACRTMLNMVSTPHGAADRRGGTRWVSEVKDSSKQVRLIPFEFSVTQAYILEFGDQYIRVYKDQGVVIHTVGTTAAWVTATGYTVGDFVNDGVLVYRCILNHTSSASDEPGVGASWQTYWVQDDTYEIPTTYLEAELDEIQFAQSADTMYIAHPNHAPAKLTRTDHTAWTLTTISFIAPPAEWTGTNYPGAVAFYEQRLWWAGTPAEPQTLWASKSADYENLTIGTAAADALNYTIATDRVNVIRWLSPGKVLIVGTVGGEFVVSASSLEEAITPTNIRIVRQSTYGSAQVTPVRVADKVVFVQRGGRKIRNLGYTFDSDSYNALDITQISEHITLGGIIETAFQQNPEGIIWFVRTDGTLVGLTVDTGLSQFGWHRHILGGTSDAGGTQAKAESIAVIPGSVTPSVDELWVAVQRYVDGAVVRHIEVMMPALADNEDVDQAFYVDAGLSYSGAPTTSITGLDHLEGETVSLLVDGATHPDRVVASGSISLQVAGSEVHAGLGYNSDLEPMQLDAGSADGTAQGKLKRITEVFARLYRTIGLEVGPNVNKLDRIPFRSSADAMDSPVELFTGDKQVPFPHGTDREARIYLRQSQPLPMTVLAIIARLKTNSL